MAVIRLRPRAGLATGGTAPWRRPGTTCRRLVETGNFYPVPENFRMYGLPHAIIFRRRDFRLLPLGQPAGGKKDGVCTCGHIPHIPRFRDRCLFFPALQTGYARSSSENHPVHRMLWILAESSWADPCGTTAVRPLTDQRSDPATPINLAPTVTCSAARIGRSRADIPPASPLLFLKVPLASSAVFLTLAAYLNSLLILGRLRPISSLSKP